jgi:hypothetical protein
MMEAVRTSETSVNFNVTTSCYILEDSKFHTRRRENLKSHKPIKDLRFLCGEHFCCVLLCSDAMLVTVYKTTWRQSTGNHNRQLAGCSVSQALKAKVVPIHAMKTLGGRGGIAPTHSRPRH